MKIAFTGGATGGHFYPIIAVAEALHDLVQEQHLLAPQLYFLAPTPFDQDALFQNEIQYIKIPAGKMRRYFSFENFTDLFVTLGGIVTAVTKLFALYPDVIISKGGFGSVPTTIAARILGIPVIVHESDARPGRANLMASKWAKKIAISFSGSARFFPKSVQGKIARTGIPIRKALARVQVEGAREYLHLEAGIPTILILGGSLGSERINDAVIGALPELVAFANIIHQTGKANLAVVEAVSKVALEGNEHASRYHTFNYLNEVSLERAAGIATLVISRAGATSVTEISLWKKPAILIPIPESVSHDQRMNAYAFAETGAAIVIEENNLSPHLLASEAHRIALHPEIAEKMAKAAEGFADPDAARILAKAALEIALEHEGVEPASQNPAAPASKQAAS